MDDKRDDREQENEMQQRSGDMEHKKAAEPQEHQDECYRKERSESHFFFSLYGSELVTLQIRAD
jgi:hypothetical protein